MQSFREEKEASDTYCEINFSGSRPETKLIVIHALNFKFCFQFSFLKAVQCYSAPLILPSRALHKTGHQSPSIISKNIVQLHFHFPKYNMQKKVLSRKA